MKKYIPVIVAIVSLFLLPSKAFAAVDLTASDATASDGTKTVTLNVNTGDDSLNQIAFDVQTSDNVTISKAVATQYTCDSFSYSNDNHILKVQCTFDTPTKLSGSIGIVTFTSASDTYSFTILNNSDLDLGGLTLGNIVNVSETGSMGTSEDTTNNTQATTDTSTSIKTQLTNYLPYVLIGGAVILLISILGIALGKKKEYPLATTSSKSEKKIETTILPKASESIVSTSMESKIRPTVPSTNPVTEIKNLEQERPNIATTIKMEETTPPTIESTNVANVKVSEDKQSKDLEEILKMENAASPMAPNGPAESTVETPAVSSPIPSVPETTPIIPSEEVTTPSVIENQPAVPTTPMESTVNSTPQYFSPTAPEIDTVAPDQVSEILPAEKPVLEINTPPQSPIPDLQSFIDTQVEQIPSTPQQPSIEPQQPVSAQSGIPQI